MPSPSSSPPLVEPPDAARRPTPVSPHIDDPMALLLACHDKVRRFAGLLLRLQTHVAVHGRDAQAQDAAKSVLRYFEIAAPLHHADEDDDLYPALLALGDAGVATRIQALSDEHTALTALWDGLAPWLRHLAEDASPCPDPGDIVRTFAANQLAHAEAEEREVYPLAARLPADARARIAQAMVARRTAA